MRWFCMMHTTEMPPCFRDGSRYGMIVPQRWRKQKHRWTEGNDEPVRAPVNVLMVCPVSMLHYKWYLHIQNQAYVLCQYSCVTYIINTYTMRSSMWYVIVCYGFWWQRNDLLHSLLADYLLVRLRNKLRKERTPPLKHQTKQPIHCEIVGNWTDDPQATIGGCYWEYEYKDTPSYRNNVLHFLIHYKEMSSPVLQGSPHTTIKINEARPMLFYQVLRYLVLWNWSTYIRIRSVELILREIICTGYTWFVMLPGGVMAELSVVSWLVALWLIASCTDLRTWLKAVLHIDNNP